MGIEALIIGTLTAIGVGGGVAAAVGGVIATVVTAGLTFAAGRLLGAIFGTPSFDPSDAQRVDLSPAAPRTFVYGTAPVGGRVIYSLLEDNDVQWIVYALTGHKINGINSVWIEEQEYSLAPNPDGSFRLNTSEDIGDVFTLYVQDGGPNQQALPELVNAQGSEWTTNHRAEGVALAIVRWEIDRDALPRGIPTQATFFEVQGKEVYDPRKDSSIGGSGDHRINQPSTWEWSTNPALCWFDHQRGHSDNGLIVFGHGFYPANLYAQANPATPRSVMEMIPFVIECANISDEPVPLRNGGVQPRYTIDAAFRTNLERDRIDESFQQAVSGYVLDGPAGNRIVAGSPSPTVDTITNLRAIENPTINLISETDVAFNVARAQYLEPDAVWREFDAPPYRDQQRLNDDGQIRPRQVSLPHQSNNIRAQRLSKIALERSRVGVTVSWLEHLDKMNIQTLERVVINDTALGFDNETFRIIGRTFRAVQGGAGIDAIQFTAIAEPDLIWFWDEQVDESSFNINPSVGVSSRIAAPSLTVSDNPQTNVLTVQFTQNDNRAQSIEFSRNLVGVTQVLAVQAGNIDTALNSISGLPSVPNGTPAFLLSDAAGILGETQYFLNGSSGLTLHTTQAGATATPTTDIVDITTAENFSLYIGSVSASELQNFQTASGQSGTVLIQNRLDNAEYTISARSSATNISTSPAETVTITT